MLTSIIRYGVFAIKLSCPRYNRVLQKNCIRDKNELSPIRSGRTKELYTLKG